MTEWWFTDYGVWDNLKMIAWRIWKILTTHNNKGCGCICGAQAPDEFVWLAGRAYGRWWDHHVENECLLSRDEYGNVLTYE